MKDNARRLSLSVGTHAAHPARASSVPAPQSQPRHPGSTYGSAYNTNEDVTLSFSVASPLPTSFSGSVSPVSFTAFDGIMTISSSSYTSALFDVQTAAGQITDWHVFLTNNTSDGGSDYIYSSAGLDATSVDDQAYIFGCPNESCEEAYAANSFTTPGTWTAGASVPEPSTWSMMLLGLAGLGFAMRHSRRKSGADTTV